jgi:flagellar basal body-associated protein FliL
MKYSHTSSPGKALPIVIAVVLLVIIAGGAAALFFSGSVKVGPSVASSNSNGLCDGIIANYNSAFTETSVENHASKLADSAKAAAAVNNNQTDPNCVYIQFTNALYTKNVAETTKFLNQLKALSNDGKYITGELANPLGIKAIEQNAAAVVSPNDINSTSSIKGNG